MAQVKAAEADAFIDKQSHYRLFLVYGPDSGLVTERADKIAANTGTNLTDPFAYVRLDADAAARDGRLMDEAGTMAMFGGERLIRVTGQTRRNLALPVKTLLDDGIPASRIIIEAGDLKRDAALRRTVERGKTGVAIPCYGDGPRELDRLVTSILAENGLQIEPGARQFLLSMLGSDRRVSRSEIEKLALYRLHGGTVSEEDVRAIVGDSSALAVADLGDLVLRGDAEPMSRQFGKLLAAGEAPDMVLLAVLRLFQLLHQVRSETDRSGRPVREIVSELKPPVHFSRRDALVAACLRWTPPTIEKAMARLDQSAFECRANASLGPAAASAALLAVALQARQRTL
jgi:DNA polymerase III subunit delta